MTTTRRHTFITALAAVAALLTATATALGAQESDSRAYNWKGTHELSLKVGFPPYYMTAFDFYGFLDSEYKHTRLDIPSFALEYGWNVEKWLSVGCGLYYGWARYRNTDSATGEFAFDEDRSTVSLLLNARVYWLNRRMVRMYTSAGVGAALDCWSEGKTYTQFDFDIRLIGLTVGERLFGNFELGVWPHGLVTAGIGYRF